MRLPKLTASFNGVQPKIFFSLALALFSISKLIMSKREREIEGERMKINVKTVSPSCPSITAMWSGVFPGLEYKRR